MAQFQEELQYFEEDEKRTLAYLDIGYRDANKEMPASKLAALSRVANTILNTTEAYYKNQNNEV